MSNRTVQEFVEDYVSDGKSFKQIRTIAAATRWSSHRAEIEDEFQRLRRRRKELSRNNRKGKNNA